MRFSLFIALALCICLSYAGTSQYLENEAPASFITQVGNVNITQTHYFFYQDLDHFDPVGTTTWNQRFTVYADEFNPLNGTVFVYIGGEGEEAGLNRGSGWFVQLAKQYSAMFISVEHRFYGVSQPFGYSETSYSTQNLRYLSVDQSLADLANVIATLKRENFLGVSNINPFITIGGSYPGAMSAWFRYKYPFLTAGALASSAVVNAIYDFQQYDYQIYTSTSLSGSWCPINIQNFNNIIEQTLFAGGQPAADLKTLFNATSLTDVEFLSYFGDYWAGMVQYGKRTLLCDMFKSSLFSDQLDRVVLYAAANMTVEGYDIASLQNTTYSETSAGRQWTWQVCTEFGWFQTANQVQPMRSRQIDVNFYLQQCNDAFQGEFSPPVNVTNTIYGGKNIAATNIVFTNGVEDEWQWASIRQSQNGMVAIISNCQDCAHCVELYAPKPTDSASLAATRVQVTQLFSQWIKAHFAGQDNASFEEPQELVHVRSYEIPSFVREMLLNIRQ